MAKRNWETGRSLSAYTTLQAGGPADRFFVAGNLEEFADAVLECQREGKSFHVFGSGSNMLVSDAGIRSSVILNRASRIAVARSGEVLAETGCGLQDLFLKTLQSGLRGFEFAVGIPGTLGGALASNAGAYRSAVSEFITELEVVHGGERQWVAPNWMDFSYRDSRLRNEPSGSTVVLRVRMLIPSGELWPGYLEAREYQRQRISKQPAPASAGSFFKNVNDADLADRITNLPPALKERGIIPSGFLIEGAGMRGFRRGRAALSSRHANFVLNLGGATATELRDVAELAKLKVRETFGVHLEEEVLYVGDWSRYVTP